MVIALFAIGCSKKDPAAGGGTGTTTAGISVPKEISALPTKGSAAGGVSVGATGSTLRQALRAGAGRSLAADSDYETAQTVKFVDERALSQFDILNTIFSALGQTHYADAENIGAGPYGNMVAWVEERGDGQNSKRLVPWIVDSSMAVEAGRNVNVVQVWMRDMMESGPEGIAPVIKAELKIYEPPTQKTDGSYADYGVWTINASFGGPPPSPGGPGSVPGGEGEAFFSASAGRDADGLSVVMLHEKEGPDRESRGIMQRSDDRGFGKVNFPDWSQCHQPECPPQPVTVAYVYNAEHVALKKGEDVVYKDRSDVVDLVHRYGLYDAVTGADVSKSRSFGFPLRYTDDQNRERHGYYGAWQGRHQIWSDGQQGIPEGTTVFRADRPPGQQTESYTVSKAYTGTLVKRTLVPAAITDIRNLVVETWVHQNMSLQWKETGWYNCVNPDYMNYPPTCGEGSGFFADWASLVVNPNDRRRNININYWDQTLNQGMGGPVNLAWVPAGLHGPGLYKVIWSTPHTPPTTTDEIWWSPTEGFAGGEPQPPPQLWVNVNGSVYITYDGASWVQKTVLSFDEETWTPTFEPDGDLPYSLELGREYYINNPGANYIVKRTGETTYDVQIELQSVANPLNIATFVPDGTIFKEQWGGEGQSTYRFETSASSPNYMKLVYATKGDSDNTQGVEVGALVKQGRWGLVAWVNGASTGTQYNWDYPQDGQDWGSQQYLVAADGSFKMLDDPIRLKAVPLQNHAEEQKTYALQFDGSWVGGLPDIFRELQKNDFILTDDIAAKVVVIPEGTEVEDAADSSKHYLFKPLQMNEYLAVIADAPELDLEPAATLDLQQVPSFVPHDMGDPPDVAVKYSEGNLVQ